MFTLRKLAVNNFQSLSAEFVRTKESQGKSVELARQKMEISSEIIRHSKRMKEARHSAQWSSDMIEEPEESKWWVLKTNMSSTIVE